MVTHLLPKQRIAGSSPVLRSRLQSQISRVEVPLIERGFLLSPAIYPQVPKFPFLLLSGIAHPAHFAIFGPNRPKSDADALHCSLHTWEWENSEYRRHLHPRGWGGRQFEQVTTERVAQSQVRSVEQVPRHSPTTKAYIPTITGITEQWVAE